MLSKFLRKQLRRFYPRTTHRRESNTVTILALSSERFTANQKFSPSICKLRFGYKPQVQNIFPSNPILTNFHRSCFLEHIGHNSPLPQSPLVFFPALSLALFFLRVPLSERLEQATIPRNPGCFCNYF